MTHPRIITYESHDHCHPKMKWLAMFHEMLPNKGDGLLAWKHAPLPMNFWGETEQLARQRAIDWWDEEKRKEEAKVVLSEKRAAARRKTTV